MPISDSDFVVRFGEMRTSDLKRAILIAHAAGKGYALSVFSHSGVPWETIALRAGLGHPSVRVSTVGRLREAGYDVTNCTGGWHCQLLLDGPLNDEDCNRLRDCFDPPVANPGRS